MPAATETPSADNAATAAESDAGDTGIGDIALSDVVANEHERKAVQAAVARKVMEGGGAADADALNKELAEVALRYKFPPPDLRNNFV